MFSSQFRYTLGPGALGMEAQRAVARRLRSRAWRARSCRRTTGARSAARCAGPSAASAARRGRRAGCPRCRPSSRSAATTALRASSTESPRKRSPAASVMPVLADHAISSRPCLRPISKSLGSWPGVILSAPVPNSGSTYSSAMIGSRRPTSGRIGGLADQPRVALVVGVHRDRGVGQHRLRAHRGDRERARAGLERIVDQVERVLHARLLDLQVRDRRARAGIPVDHVVAAVDQALLVERHEHVGDRAHVLRRPS